MGIMDRGINWNGSSIDDPGHGTTQHNTMYIFCGLEPALADLTFKPKPRHSPSTLQPWALAMIGVIVPACRARPRHCHSPEGSEPGASDGLGIFVNGSGEARPMALQVLYPIVGGSELIDSQKTISFSDSRRLKIPSFVLEIVQQVKSGLRGNFLGII
ncbi:hypothetical protein TorRG33x02_281440, partial [Trema orientale]